MNDNMGKVHCLLEILRGRRNPVTGNRPKFLQQIPDKQTEEGGTELS